VEAEHPSVCFAVFPPRAFRDGLPRRGEDQAPLAEVKIVPLDISSQPGLFFSETMQESRVNGTL
jgi:hypothetical protein